MKTLEEQIKTRQNMRKLDITKVDAAAARYLAKIEQNLLSDHDMILFTDDYQFHLANKGLVRLSETPMRGILRAYRIDSLGNLWIA